MIPELAPNTISRPYGGLSVQEVDLPLTEAHVVPFLLGREVYRQSQYLALCNGDRVALVAVRKASAENDSLFAPVVEARVLARPDQIVSIVSPDTDVGNPSALAKVALAHARRNTTAYLVQGRYEHVNFIWRPAPITVRVTEVVPPEPPKLFAMAEQVVAFDEDLPPIELVLDAVDIAQLANAHPADRYLLPCRGCGVQLEATVEFLDTRPATRHNWLLIGCERSLQLHRHFYGDQPPHVDICPRRRAAEVANSAITLTKCCLPDRGVEVSDGWAAVPWGANLDEIRLALRSLTGVEQPRAAGMSPS